MLDLVLEMLFFELLILFKKVRGMPFELSNFTSGKKEIKELDSSPLHIQAAAKATEL
jgi:hypothetical protein